MSGDLSKPWLVNDLMISDHSIERFRVRGKNNAPHLPDEKVRQLMRESMQAKESQLILEDGAALRWLVPMKDYRCHMVVRPWTAEGPPIVMTVITNAMRAESFASKKYKEVEP
jgi:hypothetical protein